MPCGGCSMVSHSSRRSTANNSPSWTCAARVGGPRLGDPHAHGLRRLGVQLCALQEGLDGVVVFTRLPRLLEVRAGAVWHGVAADEVDAVTGLRLGTIWPNLSGRMFFSKSAMAIPRSLAPLVAVVGCACR